MGLANVAVHQEDEVSVFMLGLSLLKEEVSLCQVLPEVKVRAAAREADRAGGEAAGAVLARAPADSVSVRPVATERLISREFPASKSNVPNAGR